MHHFRAFFAGHVVDSISLRYGFECADHACILLRTCLMIRVGSVPDGHVQPGPPQDPASPLVFETDRNFDLTNSLGRLSTLVAKVTSAQYDGDHVRSRQSLL